VLGADPALVRVACCSAGGASRRGAWTRRSHTQAHHAGEPWSTRWLLTPALAGCVTGLAGRLELLACGEPPRAPNLRHTISGRTTMVGSAPGYRRVEAAGEADQEAGGPPAQGWRDLAPWRCRRLGGLGADGCVGQGRGGDLSGQPANDAGCQWLIHSRSPVRRPPGRGPGRGLHPRHPRRRLELASGRVPGERRRSPTTTGCRGRTGGRPGRCRRGRWSPRRAGGWRRGRAPSARPRRCRRP
jgi:hypothetical protein